MKAQYESAYNAHLKAERADAFAGKHDEADRHHEAGLLLSWSLVAEIDDKPPQDKNRRDWCYCANCLLATFRNVT